MSNDDDFVVDGKTKNSFAIGCFHFGVSKSSKKPPLSKKEYCDLVKTSLEGITNVSSISIDSSDHNDENYFKDRLPDYESLNESGSFFPHISHLDIKFDIYIPIRLQSELFPGGFGRRKFTEENFIVNIRHSWHGPVTFVTCKKPSIDDPSYGIVLVREFLSKSFKENANVTFEFLGPSPFHCDFFVAEAPDKPGNLERFFTLNKRQGYDEGIIRYNPKMTDSRTTLIDFQNVIESEIAFFYSVISSRNSIRGEWNSVIGFVDKAINGKISIPWIVFKPIVESRRFEEAAQKLILFKLSVSESERSIMKQFDSIYKSGKMVTFFENSTKSYSENFSAHYNPDDLLDMIKISNDIRTKMVTLQVALIASMGGGITGALFGYLFRIIT